jgi:hypothetical protein
VFAAAGRAGRATWARARVGVANLRGALKPGPEDAEPPEPEPIPVDEEEAPIRVVAGDIPAPPPPPPELDDLRHRLEERELELVAAGKGWSSLTHRAYGELRFLPESLPEPPTKREPAVEIDDAEWDPPTWRTINDD